MSHNIQELLPRDTHFFEEEVGSLAALSGMASD